VKDEKRWIVLLGGNMHRTLIGILIGAGVLLLPVRVFAQAPVGTVKLNSRSVSPGIGLSWGEGVLTYKGQNFPFTFQAKGLFRDVDPGITAAEMSGQVFNLDRVALFNGTYHKVDETTSSKGGGSFAKIKNPHGVIIDLASTVEGRKFVLGRDGIDIKIAEKKP
jgi:hypothetical protein